MNRHVLAPSVLSLLAAAVLLVPSPSESAPPETRTEAVHNPAIDMPGHLRVSEEAARHRLDRRVSEAEFIRMSHEPGTVVLDARSRDRFDELHVKGALHLSFPTSRSRAWHAPSPTSRRAS